MARIIFLSRVFDFRFLPGVSLAVSGPASIFPHAESEHHHSRPQLCRGCSRTFGEVQGKHRRPSKCWYPSPSRRIEVFDCERSDDAVSGAGTRAEVKDAVYCRPRLLMRREATPTRLVRSNRVTRKAGVPLDSPSRSPVQAPVQQCTT